MYIVALVVMLIIAIVITIWSQRETIPGQICGLVIYAAAGVGLAQWAQHIAEFFK